MLSRHSVLFMLSTTFAGLAFAFFHPLIALYLIDELGASPLAMGSFMAAVLGSGVLVSTYLGHLSDKGLKRKPLVMAGQLSFAVIALGMIVTRNYWFALSVGVLLMGLANCVLPQLFTLGRTYADEKLGDKGSSFVALMRAGIAVAWVVGPPLAFMTKASLGFNGALAMAAVSSLMVVGITLLLPEFEAQVDNNPSPKGKKVKVHISRPAILFLLSTLAMFSAINMYAINMPLYLTKVLALSDQWVGNLMGIAAFVEVPVMVLIGGLAVRYGSKPLMAIGVLAGVCFYFGLTQVDSIAALIAMQLLNGIFVGIVASLGISFMQDLMRHSLGLATTLFSNAQAASALVGSFLAGLVAHYFGYQSVFWVCTLLVSVALTLLLLVQSSATKATATSKAV